MRPSAPPPLAFVALGIVVLAVAGLSSRPATTAAQTMSAMTTYQFGLLRRGPKWAPKRTAATDSLQAGHMRNIMRMSKEGYLVAAGPFLDGGDLRGIFIFKSDSAEKVRKLADRDPAIRAGRLQLDLYPWFAPEGIGKLYSERSTQPGHKDSMVVLQFALLKKGPKHGEEATPELAGLQGRHVANVLGMIATGQAASAGPFWTSGDVAGVFILKGDSATCHRLALDDPMVASGRLAVEMHPWTCAYGTFPGDTL